MSDVKLDNPYIRWSLVLVLGGIGYFIIEKQNQAEAIAREGIAQLNTTVAVLSEKLDGFADGQKEAVTTLKSIDDKMDGWGERIGNLEGRVKLLEEWRATVDRKLDGK